MQKRRRLTEGRLTGDKEPAGARAVGRYRAGGRQYCPWTISSVSAPTPKNQTSMGMSIVQATKHASTNGLKVLTTACE